MFKNSSGDTARSLSWAMDYEFRRLCFSNEILMQPNKFLDGALLKKFWHQKGGFITQDTHIIERKKNDVFLISISPR
jgi:hypothetical protein